MKQPLNIDKVVAKKSLGQNFIKDNNFLSIMSSKIITDKNTKIVFAGDINQIDTPYLDSQSNGLSYLIDKLKGQQLYSHVTLRKGERSKLANLANELL